MLVVRVRIILLRTSSPTKITLFFGEDYRFFGFFKKFVYGEAFVLFYGFSSESPVSLLCLDRRYRNDDRGDYESRTS